MARTKSTMLALGTSAPGFRLQDPATGETRGLDDYDDSFGVLVMFLCNHCPFVKHVRHALVEFAQEYLAQGLAIVAINANDAERYPEDNPIAMAAESARYAYPFPYLYDPTQEVAQAYRAACTPDFFLFDRERRLVYRGRFDAATPSNDEPVSGEDLRAAADAMLAGREISAEQRPSIGCNIKWKPGNEPAYL